MKYNVGVFVREKHNWIATPTMTSVHLGLCDMGLQPHCCVERLAELCHIAAVFGTYKKKAHYSSIHRKRIYNRQVKRNQKILAIEQGYFQRKEYRSIGWDGCHGLADFRVKDMPPDRWRALEGHGWWLRDWQSGGANILVCGQVPWDSVVQHINYPEWVSTTVKEIRKHTDRPIVWRPHPTQPDIVKVPAGVKLADATRPLEYDLNDAWATIVYNSTSACESVVCGVPTFVLDKASRSTAYPVANKDLTNLEDPERPDREQWAYNLAYCQWNLEEVEAGLPFAHLDVVKELVRLQNG